MLRLASVLIAKELTIQAFGSVLFNTISRLGIVFGLGSIQNCRLTMLRRLIEQCSVELFCLVLLKIIVKSLATCMRNRNHLFKVMGEAKITSERKEKRTALHVTSRATRVLKSITIDI